MRLYIITLTAVLIVFSVSLFGSAFLFKSSIENTVGKALFLEALVKRLNSIPAEEEFPVDSEETRVVFVGDIMLDRGVALQIRRNGEDFRFPFLRIADWLNEAEIVFGNLEGPVSDRGRDAGGLYSFRFNPGVIEGLAFAGFDVLSIANNHIWDWGRDALTDTVSFLDEKGIKTVGAGKDSEEANRPAVLETNGTRIGFLAYTNLYPDGLVARGNYPGVSDLGKAVAAVEALKKETDIVVVSIHWGEEYQSRSNRTQQELGRSIIETGADLVIGHHPHVVQEVERYKDGWIVYSLGNFIFDQGFSEETMRGLAAEAVIKDRRIVGLNLYRVKLNEHFQPALE